MRFLNHYHCDNCGTDWTDEWDCMCDDDCPECNLNCSPHESEELEEEKVELSKLSEINELAETLKNLRSELETLKKFEKETVEIWVEPEQHYEHVDRLVETEVAKDLIVNAIQFQIDLVAAKLQALGVDPDA